MQTSVVVTKVQSCEQVADLNGSLKMHTCQEAVDLWRFAGADLRGGSDPTLLFCIIYSDGETRWVPSRIKLSITYVIKTFHFSLQIKACLKKLNLKAKMEWISLKSHHGIWPPVYEMRLLKQKI